MKQEQLNQAQQTFEEMKASMQAMEILFREIYTAYSELSDRVADLERRFDE